MHSSKCERTYLSHVLRENVGRQRNTLFSAVRAILPWSAAVTCIHYTWQHHATCTRRDEVLFVVNRVVRQCVCMPVDVPVDIKGGAEKDSGYVSTSWVDGDDTSV